MHSEENRCRTLQKNDIAAAIARTDIYDFLVDTIPRDEMKEEGVGLTAGFGRRIPVLPHTAGSVAGARCTNGVWWAEVAAGDLRVSEQSSNLVMKLAEVARCDAPKAEAVSRFRNLILVWTSKFFLKVSR
jgi:hypothetical protein